MLVGIADHPEQAQILRFAIDGPVRVENLVAAVLGVGLGKHHQFRIGRVTPQRNELFHQVFNFIRRQRQAQLTIGRFQRPTATAENIHGGQFTGLVMGKQGLGIIQLRQHHLDHPVVQGAGQSVAITASVQAIFNPALNPLHLGEAGVMTNIRRLG